MSALAGVLGWPVAHSRSPALHRYWLAEHGIGGDYRRFAVPPDRLAEALTGLRGLGLRGANVTVPHKTAAIARMDRLEAKARRIGAVNTIVVAADGALEGSNTDGYGFIENLRQGAPGWSGTAGPALLLGAGGAARSILVALLDEGIPELRVANRDHGKARALRDEFGDRVLPLAWDERVEAQRGAALLVNTTSLGMAGGAPLEMPLDALPPDCLVTDIVYAPLETPLLAAARARGNRVVDGIGMLLHQARPGFAAWFGVQPAVTPGLRAAVLAA